MAQFPITLIHCSQISICGAYFWVLQTAVVAVGPDLENRVSTEAIRSSIWQFLPLNAPIMLDNICYWRFFLSQSNRCTKYLAHPKIRRPKPCLLMFASLVALDGFHLLVSTQLIADWIWSEEVDPMFHPLSHIYEKTTFCCVEVVANDALNLWRVVFYWLRANAAPTSNIAFSLINGHTKWWIHSLLIFSPHLVSHATYDQPKRVFGVSFMFSEKTAEFGRPEHSASFVTIRLCLNGCLGFMTNQPLWVI